VAGALGRRVTRLAGRDVWAAPPGAPDAVVRGFTLEVEPGEWVALHGPNGGGKSTLALAMAGLWPVRRGTVMLDGRPLGPGADPATRAGIAAVLQDPPSQLLADTVADELALVGRNLGIPEDEVARRVGRLAAALGLTDALAGDPRALSAGGQQCALLGAALVAAPRVLVADEAGAHLDAGARARVLGLLRDEVQRGLAVIWVTQDPTEIAAADRSIAVGDELPSPWAPPAVPAPSADPGSGALTIEISPPETARGPRIAVARRRVLEVAARGVTALVGPNGAGKSVLLAAAAGAAPHPQVRISWARAPAQPPLLASQFPEQEIFQEQVLDEMAWAAIQRGSPPDRARADASAILEALGLGVAFGRRRVWSLSGGEKRLVQVGGALVTPAGLLLLDEPTAGIDPGRKKALGALVAQRSREIPVMVAGQDAGWLDEIGARLMPLGPETPESAKSQQKSGLTEPCGRA
jgi:energy-coupling factor transporter ATP-binding protein EcfA2